MESLDVNAQNKEAADYQGALDIQARKTAAYNAFAKQYGPGPAGDPAAALQLQEMGQRNLTSPIAVQQAGADLTGKNLSNAGVTESNAFALRDDPLKLEHAALENTGQGLSNAKTQQDTTFAAQEQPLKLAQTRAQTGLIGAEAGNQSASAAQTRQQTAMTGSNAEQTAKLGMVNQLMQVKQQGGDVGAAFAQMAPQLKTMAGVTASHIDAIGARLAEPGFLENAAGMLGNTVVAQKGMEQLPLADGSGFRMVPTASVPKAAPGIQNVIDPKTGQVTQRTVGMGQSPQALAIAKADLGQIDLQYARTNGVIDKAISQVGSTSTGLGAETVGLLPGSTRKALEANIQGAKSNIALLTANLSRQGGKGSAPIPVRNMAEFKAYQDALGAVDVTASAPVVRQQLQAVKTNLADLQEAVHTKFGATYGAQLAPAATPAAAPAGAGWAIKQVP